MRAENAINSWREWDADLHMRPEILGPLSGGRSNRSFLLDSNGKKMVLRINGTGSMLPGTSRKNEISIWQAASKKGIAPPLLHVDEQNRFLVSSYISNSLPSQPGNDENIIGQAFGLLKQCHLLDVHAPGIDYAAHVEQYWHLIESKGITTSSDLVRQREPMQGLLEDIAASDVQTGVCHHDLVAANFVGSTARLYLIDWEYAARGLLVMDYAALGVEWGIDDAVVAGQAGIDVELLSLASDFYRYECRLWGAITSFGG